MPSNRFFLGALKTNGSRRFSGVGSGDGSIRGEYPSLVPAGRPQFAQMIFRSRFFAVRPAPIEIRTSPELTRTPSHARRPGPRHAWPARADRRRPPRPARSFPHSRLISSHAHMLRPTHANTNGQDLSRPSIVREVSRSSLPALLPLFALAVILTCALVDPVLICSPLLLRHRRFFIRQELSPIGIARLPVLHLVGLCATARQLSGAGGGAGEGGRRRHEHPPAHLAGDLRGMTAPIDPALLRRDVLGVPGAAQRVGRLPDRLRCALRTIPLQTAVDGVRLPATLAVCGAADTAHQSRLFALLGLPIMQAPTLRPTCRAIPGPRTAGKRCPAALACPLPDHLSPASIDAIRARIRARIAVKRRPAILTDPSHPQITTLGSPSSITASRPPGPIQLHSAMSAALRTVSAVQSVGVSWRPADRITGTMSPVSLR